MFKKTMIAIAMLTLCLGVPAAFAQHGHHSKGEVHSGHSGHAGHVDHAIHSEHATHGIHNGIHLPSDEMLKEWGFDDDLISELHQLKNSFEKKANGLQEDLKEAESELEMAHKSDDVSEATLHRAIDNFSKAKAKLLKLHATAAVEARETMGEELFEKIKKAHEPHRVESD